VQLAGDWPCDSPQLELSINRPTDADNQESADAQHKQCTRCRLMSRLMEVKGLGSETPASSNEAAVEIRACRALVTLAGRSDRVGFTPTRHDSGKLFPCMQLMHLSLSAIPKLGSNRISSCAKRIVCCQAPDPSPVVTRRLLHSTPHPRPSPPQRRALLCERAQLYSTKSTPRLLNQTPQDHLSTMADQNEKPVFFFDIDNCVCICCISSGFL
jgi:hypothetical protein